MKYFLIVLFGLAIAFTDYVSTSISVKDAVARKETLALWQRACIYGGIKWVICDLPFSLFATLVLPIWVPKAILCLIAIYMARVLTAFYTIEKQETYRFVSAVFLLAAVVYGYILPGLLIIVRTAKSMGR